MKQVCHLFLLLIVFTACKKKDAIEQDKKEKLQKLLDENTLTRFPGLSLYITTKAGAYSLASGKSDIARNTSMTPETLQYAQSISKTFTAVAIMQLAERGRLNIDEKIKSYLGDEVVSKITNGQQITIRQLLNHSSGIYDYLKNPQFVNDVFNGTAFPITPAKLLSYIAGQPASFDPGASYEYSNINYALLAYIIDAVTGQSHADYFKNNILGPLGLHHTHYLPGRPVSTLPIGVTQSYAMAPGSSVFEEVTALQYLTVQNLVGDDGILSTPRDLATFYNALLRDKKLVSAQSLTEMTKWIKTGNTPIAGLGLIRLKYPGFEEQIGHPGAGLGAAAEAYYFPKYDATVVLMTNTGTLMSAEKSAAFEALWKSILPVLFNR